MSKARDRRIAVEAAAAAVVSDRVTSASVLFMNSGDVCYLTADPGTRHQGWPAPMHNNDGGETPIITPLPDAVYVAAPNASGLFNVNATYVDGLGGTTTVDDFAALCHAIEASGCHWIGAQP